MNCSVNIDWKFVVACGAAYALINSARKLSPEQAVAVLTRVVDACKEYAVAIKGSC